MENISIIDQNDKTTCVTKRFPLKFESFIHWSLPPKIVRCTFKCHYSIALSITFSMSELVKSVLPRCKDCLNLKKATGALYIFPGVSRIMWMDIKLPELLSQFVRVTRADVKHAREGERVAAVSVLSTKDLHGWKGELNIIFINKLSHVITEI